MADQAEHEYPVHHEGHHDLEHGSHGSSPLYFSIFLMLCVLTGGSVAAYYLLENTPEVAWVVMMAISCVKASLVIMFFMHLKWEANWKYVLTFPAMAMSVFLVLMLVPDIGMRRYHATRERTLHMAVPTIYDRPEQIRHEADHAHQEGQHQEGEHQEDEHDGDKHAGEHQPAAAGESSQKAE